MKKTLLTVGAATAVIAPIATAVSCSWGYEGRYEMENDGELKLFYAFSKGKKQEKALIEIQKLWNQDKSHKHLSITWIDGGYKKIGPQLTQSFEAGDTKKVPNMIIDYPDTLGVLSKYEMAIPVAGDAVGRLFKPSFLDINNQIGGIKAGSGIFALPIAKSVDMATYNTPVFKYLWDVALKNKIVKGEMEVALNDGFLSNVDDSTKSSEIKSLWVEKENNIAQQPGNEMTFEEITTDGEKMLDFAIKVRPLFKENKEAYILGIDSTVNFLYQSLYQSANADYDKFVFSKSGDFIEYNWGSGESKKLFERVYSKLRKAIETKGVYLNTGGKYSSSLETQHKIAVAYGSTAGYSHNFIRGAVPLYKGKAFAHAVKVDSTGLSISGKDPYKYKIDLKNPTNKHLTQKQKDDIKAFWNANKSSKMLYVTGASGKDAGNDSVLVKPGKYPKYLVKMTGILGTENTLQENEMKILRTPTIFGGKSNSAKATLVQGPSLIGVHANAEEDAAVLAFSEWFMGIASGTGQAPYKKFAAESGYIVPTKEAFLKTSLTGEHDNAQTLAFDVLKEIGVNYKAFDNPVDDTTGSFRRRLETALGTDYTAAKAGSHVMTATELYETMNW